MFEKAKRKVEETKFFLRELQGERNADAFEFRFNALLYAGKNVVNSIHAEIHDTELRRLGALPSPEAFEKALKEQRRKTWRLHFRAWRRTRTPNEVDLFIVLQELRDIETHQRAGASKHLAKTEEREMPFAPRPRDPRVMPIYAAWGVVLSRHIEVVTTYALEINPDARFGRTQWALIERFKTNAPKSQLEIGETYVNLLGSLVDYFSTHYT